MKRLTTAWLIIGALMAAGAAEASAPGGDFAADRIRAAAKHVCSNDATIVCDPGGGFNPAFDPTQCGTPVPVPEPTCDPEWIDGSESRGILTVILDDAAQDNNTAATDFIMTVMLDITIDGKRYAIAEIFDREGSDFSVKVGGWNTTAVETDVFSIQKLSDTLPSALAPMSARLEEIGLAAFGEPNVPIMVESFGQDSRKNLAESETAANCTGGTPKPCGLLEVNEIANTRASVAQYRVTLRFARPAPLP